MRRKHANMMLIFLIIVLSGFASTAAADSAKLSIKRIALENVKHDDDEASALSVLEFTKKEDESLMKLTYVDNLRAHGTEQWCQWSIKVDSKDCDKRIYNTVNTKSSSDDDFAPRAIVGTCSDIKKGAHTMTIALKRSSSGADCYTGWFPDDEGGTFFMEAEELNVRDDVQITTAMRELAGDDRDTGFVDGHKLTFTKKTEDSQIRITWATNLRVRPKDPNPDLRGGECHWEIRIDGQSCAKPTKIGAMLSTQGDDDDRIPVAVVGWCQGIKAGVHEIQVQVTVKDGDNSDCYTGWKCNDYMEVWEPTPDEQDMISYRQKVDTDTGKDDRPKLMGSDLIFTKKSPDSSVRILYYDNLRVTGGTKKWCRWEVTVDGKSCPIALAGSVYTTSSNDEDYYPATILGECMGLTAGQHNINVAISRKDSYADCFTGLTDANKISHALVEVQETSPTYVSKKYTCTVDNSNKKDGAACACSEGFEGTITWKSGLAVGPCESTTTTAAAATTAAADDETTAAAAGGGATGAVTTTTTTIDVGFIEKTTTTVTTTTQNTTTITLDPALIMAASVTGTTIVSLTIVIIVVVAILNMLRAKNRRERHNADKIDRSIITATLQESVPLPKRLRRKPHESPFMPAY